MRCLRWLLAEDYGLTNDGWQGSSTLELVILWGKEVGKLSVYPWLAYSASVGGRVSIRKFGAACGQCATIQRMLGDDRCVARVDGYSRHDGVAGETIIDLQPSTVVLTTFPNYGPIASRSRTTLPLSRPFSYPLHFLLSLVLPPHFFMALTNCWSPSHACLH